MSVSNDSTSTDDGVPLSSTFLEFCAKVRNNDPSILPEAGRPFKIFHRLSEKEDTELADALLENTNVTYLELGTKISAEAMAKYVRTSKRLQRIIWNPTRIPGYGGPQKHEEMLCCFLHALQESTSLKELDMELPRGGGPSNLALENMLTHTQSLRSLTLRCPTIDIDVAAARSGLKKKTTLRELTLEFAWGATTDVSPILSSLRDHPLLRRLCLRGYDVVDLVGLETLLLCDTSKITELDIHKSCGGLTILGLPPVLQALARRSTLTKLGLRRCFLGRDEARLLRISLCIMPSLQSLVLTDATMGGSDLAELAPALCHNTSINVLDMSGNRLDGMDSAEIFRAILRSNKTTTALDLSGNKLGQTTGAVECIADGLGSNSTLLKIDLSSFALFDGGVSILAQSLGSRNTTLQKLILDNDSITSMDVGVLLETMEQSSHHVTDLGLQRLYIGNEGAGLLARSLRNNALPNLTHLSLSNNEIGDDGFIALVSALEQNTSLLQLNLRYCPGVSERAFLALAELLPEIKVLQRVDFDWCTGLASAMPLLLAGLRKNTSLFRFHVAKINNCASSSVPPTPKETARCAGGWMQEMERLGYRNRFLSLIRAPKERLPLRGSWSLASCACPG
jgi:hypothetical protein